MATDHVSLQHLDEFKKILDSYQLSSENLRLLKKINFVILLAPTAAGRNTIIDELAKTGEYYFIVSDTTRPPKWRDGKLEVDGERYHFRSEDDVLADLKQGKFLEAELIHNQQVSGPSMREIQKAIDLDKIAITDMDIGGAQKVKSLKPDAHGVFILPPSFEEWQRRIKFREDMPDEEHRRRLTTALKILEVALSRDDFQYVINKDIAEAAADVHSIARFQIENPERQAAGRDLCEQLLIETQQFLRESK